MQSNKERIAKFIKRIQIPLEPAHTIGVSDFLWLIEQAEKLEEVMEYCNQTLPALVTRDIGTTNAINQLKTVKSIIEGNNNE